MSEAVFDAAVNEVIKERHGIIGDDGTFFEVDVFLGNNLGLVIAEAELSETQESIVLPEWCGREVTSVRDFYNSRLAIKPLSTWSAEERRSFDL